MYMRRKINKDLSPILTVFQFKLGNNNLNHQISSFSNQNVNLVNSPNNSSNNSLHDLTQNLTTSTSNNNDNSLNLNESQGNTIPLFYFENHT